MTLNCLKLTVLCCFAALMAACHPAQKNAIPRYDHVVILGFDGLAAMDLDSADCMPYFKSLALKSARTLHKRAVLPTWSATNWATMMMGVGPDATGYTQWNSKEPVFTPSDLGPNGVFPTVFTQFRIARPDGESFCACQWDGIKYVVDTAAISNVVMFPESLEGNDDMAEFVAGYITEKKPALTLVVWDYPDVTGHESGWYSDTYYEVLEKLDHNLQTVVDAIDSSDIAGRTLIMVTSDHGGHEFGHGKELDSDLFSPLILNGQGVREGEMQGAIYQYDIAATVAAVLGLPVPDSWRGRPIAEAFF